jgi:hypothetical protein
MNVCVCVYLHVSSCVIYPPCKSQIFCSAIYYFCCLFGSTKFFTLFHSWKKKKKKKIENGIGVLIFPKIFFFNISYSWKNLARYYYKCMLVFGERRDVDGRGTALQAERLWVPFLMVSLEFFNGVIFISASNRKPYRI